MRIRTLALFSTALAATFILAGCSTPSAPSAQPIPQHNAQAFDDLSVLDAETLIDRLDRTPVDDRPAGLTASIRPDAIVLTDASGEEKTVPLPEDRVYVSFAPYRQQTHDCYYHAPVNCLGELRNTDIHVAVTDAATDEVYYDDDTRTFDNGFVGLWLPRGITATVTITTEGQSATGEISTDANDDATCITTLRLV